MRRKAKKGKTQRTKIEFSPVIFPEIQLDCMVRIDGWQIEVKRPGQRKEIEEFAINLSYSDPLDRLEPNWKPVKRYDCKHHYVEKHEYWISHRARRIQEWEGKTMTEVLNLAKRDLVGNFARYIEKMLQKRRRR